MAHGNSSGASSQDVREAVNSQSSTYRQHMGAMSPYTPSEGGAAYSDDSTLVAEACNQLGQSVWLTRTLVNTNAKGQDVTGHSLSDDAQLRQQALHNLLQRGRRKAEAEYLRTSDASVFDPFLSLFVAKKSSTREWVLDQPTQRWYLYDPDTEAVLWCPTADSFA
ncbi:hypothetical protein VPNG_09351 [Cytospora leucostoma]|uniref:Uncharacterized protein n=1 Tax=Cytospora leucostoma TaxID=1230097 RepID=A0A423VSU6_9PEZI|nr:hypothetical protein VPNG_09351 [Cytospora leucostoma]